MTRAFVLIRHLSCNFFLSRTDTNLAAKWQGLYFFLSIMQVTEVNGEDVVCLIKNSATLAGSLYTLHVSQIRIDLPTLTDKDKEVCPCFHQMWFLIISCKCFGIRRCV